MRLGGGIPKGSLMIIEGEEGAGKSILSQRITYGALVNGHSVTYISTEMNILDFVRQMDSLNYPVAPFMLENKLLFITLINLFGKVKPGRNLIFELQKPKAKKLFEKDLVIIDSLSYPLVNNISLREAENLIEFLLRIKSLNKTILLTYDPQNINPILVNNLRRVSDIYFQVGTRTLAGQLTKYVEVRRFRNPREQYSLLTPFRVEPGLGLIVEITTIV
jgi:flagellar protein FlaH